ncbi:hypothetical protein GQ53DRAFT_815110 [Thozetella sp. PMI_491]|nr:hypothetical protein GQ53DRAFT_815110 [Thozetella sp. PMI_491]
MVAVEEAKKSNSRISAELPDGLVAVFAGGTSGIGEYTLRALVKYARKPKLYLVGRVQEAANKIISECKVANPEAQLVFFKSDLSNLENVDRVCNEIKRRETTVNVLFLSQGTLDLEKTTEDGKPLFMTLSVFSRARFIANLLPQIEKATALRRVVSVFCGSKEGPVDLDHLDGKGLGTNKIVGHATSMITLYMEKFAQSAPTVSFVHTFPGPVKSGITREARSLFVRIALGVAIFLVGLTPEGSGELHLFVATSQKYPSAVGSTTVSGISLRGKLGVAKGSNGEVGSGMYSIDQAAEPASPKGQILLASLRKDGLAENVWGLLREI